MMLGNMITPLSFSSCFTEMNPTSAGVSSSSIDTSNGHPAAKDDFLGMTFDEDSLNRKVIEGHHVSSSAADRIYALDWDSQTVS